MKQALTATLITFAVFTANSILAGPGHNHGDHDGHNHAAHAGHNHSNEKVSSLLLPGIGAIEVAHDKAAGKVTLYVTDSHKKALPPENPPRLNLFVGKTRKQLKTTAVKGTPAKFEVIDDALKHDLKGKVVIKLSGKTHQVDLDPHAGHNHGPGEHHGH